MAIQKGPSGILGTSIEAGEITDGSITAAKLASGSVTTAKLDSSLDVTGTINGFTPTVSNMAGRNRIINGDMRISQRGDYTSPVSASNNGYYLDRWVASIGTVSATVQQTNVVINGVSKTAQKIAATSSGTGYIGLAQRVELINLQDGETYTVSCWVRSNNANTSFRTTLSGAFADTSVFTNDGNWEKVSTTITLNKAALPYISVGLNTYQNGTVAVASGDYIEFTEFQLEAGSVATPFEHRQYGQELALCQRYLPAYNAESGSNTSYGSSVQGGNTTRMWITFQFPVATRTAPTGVSISSTSHFIGAGQNTNMTLSAVNFQYASRLGAAIFFDGSGGTSQQAINLISQNASGQILFTGCEL